MGHCEGSVSIKWSVLGAFYGIQYKPIFVLCATACLWFQINVQKKCAIRFETRSQMKWNTNLNSSKNLYQSMYIHRNQKNVSVNWMPTQAITRFFRFLRQKWVYIHSTAALLLDINIQRIQSDQWSENQMPNGDHPRHNWKLQENEPNLSQQTGIHTFARQSTLNNKHTSILNLESYSRKLNIKSIIRHHGS